MLPLASAFTLLACVQTAQGPRGEVVSGAMAARIDAFLGQLEGFDYNGSILIEREGEVVLRKAYGYADRPAGRALTTADAFDIGSMAKTFTAALVLELERRARLALGDRLARFFPEAPSDKANITLEQLLTHSSGVAADFPVDDPNEPFFDDVDRATAVARILAQPLEFAPGTRSSYSNCGYILLAAVVQQASGKRFQDFAREVLFAPAGMAHTGFWGAAPPAGCPVALGHDELGRVLLDPSHMPETWYDLGGGEVWSTLDDLCAWIHALSSATVLDPEHIERMFEPRTRQLNARDGRYAYGWFVQGTARGTRQIHHGGDHLGTGAWLRWYPEDDTIVAAYTGVRHDFYPTQNVVQSVLPAMIFDDARAPEIPAFATLDAAPPPELAGTYELESGGRLVLRSIRGRLYVGAEGQDATDVLAPTSGARAEERAFCSRAWLAAIEGALRGERSAIEALLGPQPNPAFSGLFETQLQRLVRERGGLRRAVLLGTFATGWPHGPSSSRETTLVRIECAQGEFVEAIRWSERVLSWNEEVEMPLASCVPLQLGADGAWVGWKLVEAVGLRLRTATIDGKPGIELESAGHTTRARKR